MSDSLNYGSSRGSYKQAGSYIVKPNNRHSNYGSGVESKHSSNLNSNGYSATRGSVRNAGYSATRGSWKTGSNALFTIANIGIHSYSINYCTFNKHSGKKMSGNIGYSGTTGQSGTKGYSGATSQSGTKGYSGPASKSGTKGYSGLASKSGTKGYSGNIGSKKYFNDDAHLFTPTRMPTEALPPIYSPPRPTYSPTSSLEIPQLPITFHINQHGKLYIVVSPITSIAVTKVISKIANLDKKYITNLKFESSHNNRRRLADSFTLSYNITIPVLKNMDPSSIYQITKKNLIDSVANNTFNSLAHNEGVDLNVTSINVAPYIVDEDYHISKPTYKPSLMPISNSSVTSESNINSYNDDGNSNKNTIIIILVSNCTFFIIVTMLYIHHRKQRASTTTTTLTTTTTPMPEREVSLVNTDATTSRRTMIDVIPNPLQKRLPVE
jgi:hypothetical protein